MVFDINFYHILVLICWQSANILVGQFFVDIFSTPIYPIQFEHYEAHYLKNQCRNFYIHNSQELLKFNQIFLTPLGDFPDALHCAETDDLMVKFRSLLAVGAAFGAVLSGILADTYGRKRIGFLVILMGIISLGTAVWAKSLHTFFISRFFTGISIGGVLVVMNVWTMESVLPKQRMVVRGLCNEGVTCLLMTAICFLTSTWRMAYAVSSICLLPAFVLSLYLPESAVWLHSKQKTKRMIESEQRISNIAGIPYEPSDRPVLSKRTMLSVISIRDNLSKTLILIILYALVYFSAELILPNHSDLTKVTPFVYYLLMGAFVAIGKFGLLMMDWRFEKFTRRFFHIGSTALFVSFFVGAIAWWYLTYTMNFEIYCLIGTVLVGFLQDALILSTIEQIDTNLRATIFGFFVTLAMLSGLVLKIKYNKLLKLPFFFFVSVFLAIFMGFWLFMSPFELKETKNIQLESAHLSGKKNASQEETELVVSDRNV